MLTSHFGRILLIWCFNNITFSSIYLGVSVIALFVPTGIITFCISSCNKSLTFSLISSIFPPVMGRIHVSCFWQFSLLNAIYHGISNNQNSFLFLFFCDFLLFSFWFLISCHHLTNVWFPHFIW